MHKYVFQSIKKEECYAKQMDSLCLSFELSTLYDTMEHSILDKISLAFPKLHFWFSPVSDYSSWYFWTSSSFVGLVLILHPIET